MAVCSRFLVVAGALGALIGLQATAQTPAAGLVKPAAMQAAASKAAPGKWTCMSRATVEIAPVSFDTSGEPAAWVMVHRIKGEIVASERISARQVDEIRRLPCGARDSNDGGVASDRLVG